ncbi:KpsF/GutQ family sugar-phosphate isomerase [Hahella ganghwensis]|uniref:KpsF/GutQ family sugar-phosphate isomerase n=1 Tax=Hahella ganghwensis TaxID=286420 RepID=UPI0003720409|nr:KpsF/GutQ family sugar-phosphate isomerase [Hahella ganghwensis]
MTDHSHEYIKAAIRTIEIEAESVATLKHRVDEDFVKACDIILACEGRVVVTGMGKSGHIGTKIAATLASTGTPAFFVHPGEASHGDLGMITSKDVVLALSNSGNTAEVVTILPLIKRMNARLISMTGNPKSTMSQMADVNLDVSVASEACPLGLAPTSSTTASLVFGDALAIALLEARGFSAEDFAFSHPGGALGRRLLLKVSDIMHADDRVPVVKSGESLSSSLLEMTRKGLGMTCVVDANNKICGIFTDGDLRRSLDKAIDIHNCVIDDVMTKQFKYVSKDTLAAEALSVMQQKAIGAMPVVTESGEVIGAFNMQDMLRAGVV